MFANPCSATGQKSAKGSIKKQIDVSKDQKFFEKMKDLNIRTPGPIKSLISISREILAYGCCQISRLELAKVIYGYIIE